MTEAQTRTMKAQEYKRSAGVDDHEAIAAQAVDAYETIAERFAEHSETSAHNAYCERPATLSLLPDVRGLRVLDAGCGPGFYAEWLARHGAEVVAIDGSPRMVALTQQRVGPEVTALQWNLLQPLDFLEDSSFDLVLCPLALDAVRDLTPSFAEFHRILRPAGLLVFSLDHPTHAFMRCGRNYFATELIADEPSGFGIPIPYYRRPLSAILEPLAAVGFSLEQLVEARPTEACKQQHPQMYAELSRRPSFLCIRARRPMLVSPGVRSAHDLS
jgi:SAM-dependent methyltransferase